MVPGPLTLWRSLRALLGSQPDPVADERERAFEVLAEELTHCAEVVPLRPNRSDR